MSTYLSFPRIGDSPMMTDANADLTCWLASDTRSLTQGKMFVIITDSLISGDRFEQNSIKKINKLAYMNTIVQSSGKYFNFSSAISQ